MAGHKFLGRQELERGKRKIFRLFDRGKTVADVVRIMRTDKTIGPRGGLSQPMISAYRQQWLKRSQGLGRAV